MITNEVRSLATELLQYTARQVASDNTLRVKLMALMGKIGRPMPRYCERGCHDAMNYLSKRLKIKRGHGKKV